MKGVTQELSKFVAEIQFQDLPAEVVHESKRLLLDSLGCAVAGISVDKGKISITLARRLGGHPEATILGIGGKVSCAAAAFVNGELIQALDYEPLLRPPGHVSPFVISAPLALAESVGASGKDLIVATAIAHEISARLAVALGVRIKPADQGSKLVKARPRYPMIVFGGAAAASKVMHLDAETISRALGIAGYFTPISSGDKWANTQPPSMTKYAPAGWISEAQVTAVMLAEAGYAGDSTIFDGEYGFGKLSNSDMWDPDILVEKLGEKWTFLRGIHYKPYPCCGGMSIAALGLFSKIIEENALMPKDIEKLTVLVESAALEPRFLSRDIRDHVAAQFSIPYVFAVEAHRVRVGADWQELDTIKNPQILKFMEKIDVAGKPYLTEKTSLEDYRDSLASCAIEVKAKGRIFKKEATPSKEAPWPRMTDGELVEKFKNNTSRILTQSKMDKAVNLLLGLERLEDVHNLMQMLVLQTE